MKITVMLHIEEESRTQKRKMQQGNDTKFEEVDEFFNELSRRMDMPEVDYASLYAKHAEREGRGAIIANWNVSFGNCIHLTTFLRGKSPFGIIPEEKDSMLI